MAWICVGECNSFEVPSFKTLSVENHPIAVFRRPEGWFAIEDCCSHQGLPLSDGRIDKTEIACPFHGARFCLKTGKALCAPAFGDIKTYPVKIEDDNVFIEV